MNVGLVLEITANMIEQVILIGFLYLFFDKPESKVKRIIPLCAAVCLLSAASIYFTFNEMTFHFLYYIFAMIVMVLYAVLFLKGKLYLRIIIPIAVSNISIAYLTVNVMSTFGKIPFSEAVTSSEAFRCLVLFTANAFYAVFLFVIYRFSKGKINMRNLSDILAFIVIPLITCTVGFTALLAFAAVDFNGDIQIHITIIALSTGLMAVIFWYLLIKVSKDYRVKADLMVSHQREELYRQSVLSTNEQIEKISAVKHDAKNMLMSASMLISQGEYNKAKALCESMSEQLSAAYTPVHTDNPMLNAIMNVEIEKAQEKSIDFSYEIGDTLRFVEDTDIVSIIGNLCDNAMEYLVSRPVEERKMTLSITVHQAYYCVICRNAVAGSVLQSNPDLQTTKGNKTLHGKGIGILRNLAEKYGGELLFNEDSNQITVSVIMMN